MHLLIASINGKAWGDEIAQREADKTKHPTLAATFALEAQNQALVAETAGDSAQIFGLAVLDPASRAAALRAARVVLTRNPFHKLAQDEIALLAGAALVQFMPAGIACRRALRDEPVANVVRPPDRYF